MVDPVAFAGEGFEALAIEDRQASVVIIDEPGALKLARGFGHAGAPDPEHGR